MRNFLLCTLEFFSHAERHGTAPHGNCTDFSEVRRGDGAVVVWDSRMSHSLKNLVLSSDKLQTEYRWHVLQLLSSSIPVPRGIALHPYDHLTREFYIY